MNYAIAGGALLLLVACFDTAKRMSLETWRRNPFIVVAVIVVGVGCVLAIFGCALTHFGLFQWATLSIVTGRLIHFFADRRAPFHVESRHPAGDCTCTPAVGDRLRQQAAVFDIKTGDSVGGRARVSAVR